MSRTQYFDNIFFSEKGMIKLTRDDGKPYIFPASLIEQHGRLVPDRVKKGVDPTGIIYLDLLVWWLHSGEEEVKDIDCTLYLHLDNGGVFHIDKTYSRELIDKINEARAISERIAKKKYGTFSTCQSIRKSKMNKFTLMSVIISASLLSGCAGMLPPPVQETSVETLAKSYDNACGHEIFSAKSKDRMSYVRVCAFSKERTNFIKFNYQEIGYIPAKVDVPAGAVYWIHTKAGNEVNDAITIMGTDGAFSVARQVKGIKQEGVIYMADKGKERIIELDPNTIKMNVTYQGYGLDGLGVSSLNSKTKAIKHHAAKVLAPQ